MGEGTHRVGREAEPEKLEREVESIRDNMTDIVSELDRRRHELFDWRLQLRRHALAVGLIAGSIALLAGTAVTVKAVRRRRQKRLLAKSGRFFQAVLRMLDRPEEVARPRQKTLAKVVSTLASTAAGIVAKALLQRFVQAPERGAVRG